ncbi:MAG: FAD binding domain-containing protein, partial [Geminicoccaceae bacterium]|nr:FAD binding domain-containing protein [Geminicoccaceae bacterium]
MYNFNYQRPASVADAAALAANGAKLLAGGQTLVASLKLRLADPGTVADLAGLRKELSHVRREGDKLV